MIKRLFQLELGDHRAAFLWGPRKTGKSTLLKQQFPTAKTYDLLKSDVKAELLLRPARLREELVAQRPPLVIIDEIQKVPQLLDEVQWCIENTDVRFILCGSSARKLRHGAANLLGGRAWRFELFPLVTAEIKAPDLHRIVNHGLVPTHYLEKSPNRSLRAYILDYLNEEIQAEALVRRIPAFAKFMESVALSHGELINYSNIARDCGVSSKTVREYYVILEDTLLGHTLPPWRKRVNRRLIETAKFYLFDVGVARALRGLQTVEQGTELFGRAFEHFLIEEMRAYLAYREKWIPMSFWRTSTGYEVDLIVGELDLAIEFKATLTVRSEDLRGLKALLEEHAVKRAIVVCLESEPRQVGPILILPWQQFCKQLWVDEWL